MTPDTYTISETYLDVGDGHRLYVQDWGNARAKTPILFLHGGPGSGVKDKYRQSFNPLKQRVVFFDQRGSGKSTPSGSLENNTTADLVEDIEKLAKNFGLDKFIITGGSWGSCLALAYALKYPKHIQAMVLHGIFTGTKSEIDWIDQGGFRVFYPEIWDKYVGQTPKAHQNDPSAYHFPRITGTDQAAAKESAYAYSTIESSLLTLDDRISPIKPDDFDPTVYKFEAYYQKNLCFMPDRYILDNARKLKMPIWLVQGRYDMVCPPVTAYQLSKKLPNCELIWVTGGHSGGDRANYDAVRTILLQLTR